MCEQTSMNPIPDEQIEKGPVPDRSEYVLIRLVKEKRCWQIRVEGGQLITTSGVIGTKSPRINARPVHLNKSGRDLDAQCWLEARQCYKKKKQEGYKVEGEREEVGGVGRLPELPSIAEVMDEEPSADDCHTVTSTYRARHPMLAQQYEKRLKVKNGLSWPMDAQVKSDGVRGLLIWTPSGIAIYSRTLHHYFFMDHIREAGEELLRPCVESLVLDGELYCHGVEHELITSIATQKTRPHPQESIMVFYVFDCYDLSRPDMLYRDRRALLRSLIPNNEGVIRLIEEQTVNNEDELKVLHEKHRLAGYEGTMLRTNEPYHHGRSLNLLKYKFHEDMDSIIVDVLATEGNDVNFMLEIEGDKRFPHRPEGTVADKQSWLTDPSLVVGRVYSFQFVSLTNTGIPKAIHNGRVRFDDVDVKEMTPWYKS